MSRPAPGSAPPVSELEPDQARRIGGGSHDGNLEGALAAVRASHQALADFAAEILEHIEPLR